MQIIKILSGVAVSTLAGIGVKSLAKKACKHRKHAKEKTFEKIYNDEFEDAWKKVGTVFNPTDDSTLEDGVNTQVMLFGLTDSQVYLIKKALYKSKVNVYVSDDRLDIYKSNADLIIANFEGLKEYERRQVYLKVKYRECAGDLLLVKDFPEFRELKHVFIDEKAFDKPEQLKETIEKGVIRSSVFKKVRRKALELYTSLNSVPVDKWEESENLVDDSRVENSEMMKEVYLALYS